MLIDANGLTTARKVSRGESRALEPEEVVIARAFLAQCDRTKTGRIGSYGLKHVIESAAGVYISNGACIRAAVDLGLVVIPVSLSEGNPNCWIGVSRRSVRLVAMETRKAR